VLRIHLLAPRRRIFLRRPYQELSSHNKDVASNGRPQLLDSQIFAVKALLKLFRVFGVSPVSVASERYFFVRPSVSNVRCKTVLNYRASIHRDVIHRCRWMASRKIHVEPDRMIMIDAGRDLRRVEAAQDRWICQQSRRLT
jgi:hypothetical protein